ncbi:hypothetical protein LRK24_11300 [Rhodanobacter denitrificans]|uniref:hypothetical protein n=1 Tax=Rhodanobacter TaxID=75309 RepID=UPI0012DDDC95|nr:MULTISPECIES: hypothetical protein [Rhodanobacter]UJM89034.1 hypothetical protein LRK24_11300 [Rhodanobacter denitrificans]
MTRFDSAPRHNENRISEVSSSDVSLFRPARVAHGITGGVETLDLIFPAPTGEEKVDVSYLLKAPNLAKPFAYALLSKLTPDSVDSRHSFCKWLRLGFFRYLADQGREDVSLSELDLPLIKGYVHWLEQAAPGEKTARWSHGTRNGYLHALRNTIDILKKLPKWNAQLRTGFHVPSHQWIGAKRLKKPTEILNDEELADIYKACLDEITAIRSRVEADLELATAARFFVPKSATSSGDYRTRDVALAAFAEMLPERIPCYPELEKNNTYLLTAVKTRFGGVVDLRTAFVPGPRQLVPFAVMLAFHTRLNPETLLGSELDDYYVEDRFGEPRFFARPTKGRARRRQRPSAPVDDSWDNPASIYDFVKGWTSRIRPLAPHKGANRLFIYVPKAVKPIVSFFDVHSSNGNGFGALLRRFCRDHNLQPFSLKQIRPTMLDLGRTMQNGDIRAAQALGDHRHPDTTNSHYTSSAQRKRNEERLGEIMSERIRWVESGGKIDVRDAGKGGDEGAATPGWRCFDPYQSPYSPHGKLCIAYAYCPVCPLGHIDVASPEACALALSLLDAIRRAKGTLDPQGWLERMGPIERRLVEYWLPRFDVAVMDAARRLVLPLLPTPE